MAQYVPLQSTVHKTCGFTRATHLAHAQHDRAAPVVLDELSNAMVLMPLGFILTGGTEAAPEFQLVAVTGLSENKNLFVQPDTLKWLAGYMPACYRAYPFAMGQDAESGEGVLCIDESSDLIQTEPGPNDVRFFDDNGQPSQAVQETFNFLQAIRHSQEVTQKAVNALTQAGVIVPWPIEIKTGESQTETIKGFYKIDRAALNALPAETLASLMKQDSLAVAYAQLFSTQQLNTLGKMLSLHKRAENGGAEPDLDQVFGSADDDTFRF